MSVLVGGIVDGYDAVAGEAGPFVLSFLNERRISEESLREEPLNSAGEFINVRIRISEASFTRQSWTVGETPEKEDGLSEEGVYAPGMLA